MRWSILVLVGMASAAEAREAVDPLRLKARAALALAFSEPPQPTYSEQYAKAVKEAKPLVVWVGQPPRHLADCVGVAREAFPQAAAEAVVIGVPAGGSLRRIDLPGRPSDAAIQAALRRGSDQPLPAPP